MGFFMMVGEQCNLSNSGNIAFHGEIFSLLDEPKMSPLLRRLNSANQKIKLSPPRYGT